MHSRVFLSPSNRAMLWWWWIKHHIHTVQYMPPCYWVSNERTFWSVIVTIECFSVHSDRIRRCSETQQGCTLVVVGRLYVLNCKNNQKITFYFSDWPTKALSRSLSNHRTQIKLNFFVVTIFAWGCRWKNSSGVRQGSWARSNFWINGARRHAPAANQTLRSLKPPQSAVIFSTYRHVPSNPPQHNPATSAWSSLNAPLD